jgi:putative ATP-binding cassette transporter
MRRLVAGLTRLTWVTAGYGWFAIVAPVLVAAPAFFGGDMTLGGLMVVVGAFTQVQQSLRWFVDNFNTIADWLATLRRVASFRRALVDMDKPGAEIGRIEFGQTGGGILTFDNLTVVSPAGSGMLSEAHVKIARGERVLITGDQDVSLTTLFRAIAGVWLWGSGVIHLPSEPIMFMPRRPYMPTGPLREALVYPSAADAFRNEDLAAACARLGLANLSSQLDREANWSNELGGDELQRLAFARLLLHKPRWVSIHEGADALDEADRKIALSLFDNELAGAAVISLGHQDLNDGFSKRVLRLVKVSDTKSVAGVGPE